MPEHRLPRLRRPVLVWCALLLTVLAQLLAAGTAAAYPYADDDGPRLVLPADATFVVGQPGTAYVIEADGEPVPAIGADALPPGLLLVPHGDGTATLAGTATGPAGVHPVAVHAQSAAGSTTASLAVTIQQAPAFLHRGPVRFVVGQFASVALRTVGYPAPGISLDGDLPAGLTFVDNGDGTATLAGTPVDGPAATPVTLTAVNVVSDASLTTSITVQAGPVADTASPTELHGPPQREP